MTEGLCLFTFAASGWEAGMIIFVVWLICAAAVGLLAKKKDRSGPGWLLLAIVISPLLALVFLIVAGDGNTRRCPHCAEKIKMAAKICPHCRSEVTPLPVTLDGTAVSP